MHRLEIGRALDALHRVAAEIEPIEDPLPEFLGRLSSSIAELVSARRVGFFKLEGEQLALVQKAFGIDAILAAQLREVPCSPDGDGLVERIVFDGETLLARLDPEAPALRPYHRWIGGIGAADIAAVPWAAGRRRLGIVVAYDSGRMGGFTEDDLSVLQSAGVSAALVWQQRELAAQLLDARLLETERMRGLAKRMKELEEMKGHILNLAAHELRGPIAVVRGYLSMVADSSLDIEGLRRILPILLGKVGQMDSQVTQMLEVARLEEGRIELALQRIDLGHVVREVVEVAGLLAPPGVSILLERPPEPVLVEADPARVATVVGNLIDNAVKYSPGGGLIKCSVGTREDMVFVEVVDKGLGIGVKDQERLFSRFGRILTAENSHISGTGLGLHLSRELARLHGGDIAVSSEEGRGSNFTLLLPVTSGPA